MVKIEEMPTEEIVIEKLIVSNKHCDTVQMYRNDRDEIFISNDLSSVEEFDATNFFLVIAKEDWVQIKKFIDKQFDL